MTSFKNLITIIGIASALAAPASASALAKQTKPHFGGAGMMSAGETGGGDGYDCHYTDADGYSIPMMNGESVFVGGKIVTCSNGTIIVTGAPGATTTSTPKPTATPVRK